MTLSDLDKKIVTLASQDIPLSKEPFKELALSIGVSEDVFLARLKAMRASGLMRKFTAVVNHRKMGFEFNAMVAWDVPKSKVEQAGNIIASFDQVSHCYERRRALRWDFNLYSMIHGKTKNECLRVVSQISRKTGCRNYKILFSSHEFKKTAAKF